ncbi:MAG TPA: hypothetical protein ENO27_04130, partial [Caldithrix sp.]|nr:hypothetical protein [Caldithrix sp.]
VMKYVMIIMLLLVSLSYGQLIVNTELDVVNEGDGLISLREAVISSNETAGQQTITFNETVFLPGANRIIYLNSALELTDESGVIIDGSAGKVTLDGSQIDSNAVNFKNGLVLKAGNNALSHLYLQKFIGAAILIDSLNTGNNTIGPDNWISEGLSSGIQIIASGNNTINSNYIWSNAGYGIEARLSGNNSISDNYISLNSADGIYLYMDSGENTIQENELMNNGDKGIFIYAGSDNNIILNDIGNTNLDIIRNSLKNGMQIPDIIAKAYEIQAKIGFTGYGVQLMGVKDTDIRSNTISRCVYSGIAMDGIVIIDSSGGSPDTLYHMPEGIVIELNFMEENLNYDMQFNNAISITIQENFMQYSGSGIYGRGLTKFDPIVVGRDSLERGDCIIRENIFSSLRQQDIKKAAGVLRPADGAIMLMDLQTADISNNEILNSSAGMYLSNISELVVHSNTLNTLIYRGIDIYNVNSSVVTSNNFSHIGDMGIVVAFPLQPLAGSLENSASIRNNIFSNITMNAVLCDAINSVEIKKNSISDIDQMGISISYCKELMLEDNVVSGCSFYSLLVQNSTVINVHKNQFINPAGMGNPSLQLSTIMKATFSENVISDATRSGMEASEVDTLLMTDNDIISNNGTGCNVGGSSFIQMMHNEFHGNSNGVTLNSCDSLIVDNNTFSGNLAGGLMLNTAGNCQISNNFFIENRRVGVQIDYTDTCRVENNYIADNGYGYLTSSPSGQILRQNTIQNNELYGAYNYSFDDSLDARQNYWGHANGPDTSSSVLPGTDIGDRINEMVMYIPFLTSPTVELQLKPEITSISPEEAAFTGGGSAIIVGRQFLPGIQVYFGDSMADSVQFYTSTIIKCKIPAGELGSVDIIVLNENGRADTLQNGFTYVPVVSIEDEDSGLPKEYALYANYPNPFNPVTTISYTVRVIRESPLQHIDLSIYNSIGQK